MTKSGAAPARMGTRVSDLDNAYYLQPTCRATSQDCLNLLHHRPISIGRARRGGACRSTRLIEEGSDRCNDFTWPRRKREKVVGVFVHRYATVRLGRPTREYHDRQMRRARKVSHPSNEALVTSASQIQ